MAKYCGKDIYREIAPILRKKGFWPLPVGIGGKGCSAKGWPDAYTKMSYEELISWDEKYANCGVALLAGTPLKNNKSIAFIDIDDDRYVPLARIFLSGEICERFGSKGAGFIVKVPEGTKNSKYSNAKYGQVYELLAQKSILVIPPTIHPKTGNPYIWKGKNIEDIEIEKLSEISEENLKFLKFLCEDDDLAELFEADQTHGIVLKVVDKIVRFTTDVDLIIQIISAVLGEGYQGNSLDEIPTMVESAIEKGFDKQKSSKGKAKEEPSLFDLIIEESKLYHTSDYISYIMFKCANGKNKFLNIRSAEFRNELQSLIYELTNDFLKENKLNELIDQLSAYANTRGKLTKTYIRKAYVDGVIYIDIGNSQVVKITESSWEIVENSSIPFVSPSGMLPLPKPVHSNLSSLNKLQDLLGLEEENWLLILSFIISTLHPTGPYFVLMVEGEQGSGKSLLCELLKQILDPSKLIKYRPPKTLDDLMIITLSSMVIVVDNVSFINAEMSDHLCGLATGTGAAKRQLYTDLGLVIIEVCRPIILNGIVSLATRPDLLDRSIIVNLKPMSPEKRKPERQLRQEFEEILPEVLGALYSLVSGALKFWGKIESPKNLRMADCAEWLMAAEKSMGMEEGKLVDSIFNSQTENVVERIENNVVFILLKDLCKAEPWEGTVGNLYTIITHEDNRKFFSRYDLPGSPSQLSKDLKRLAPAYKKAGITIDFLPKTKEGRKVRISYEHENPKLRTKF